MNPFITPQQQVEVYRVGDPTYDRFGNLVPGLGEWDSILVVGWAVTRTEEQGEDSVLRTVDTLQLQVPVGDEPEAEEKVRLPDGTVWEVEGNPEDHNHGPFWAPGVTVVNCKHVEG